MPDNLKAAVIRAAFAVVRDSALHRSYRELARHYGFKVDPTPPYAPRKKGKVESAVKYVKRNALAGRHGEDIALVNPALLRWCEEVAGDRTHGTTGRAPRDVFRREEQSALRELPARRYEPTLWKQATVHGDTHICFDGRLYSVPWRWVGKQVWVQATLATVAIFDDDERIATHRRGGPGKRSTIESHLPEHRRDLRHRSFTYWRERAARIGPQTAALVNEVFASDEVLSQLRKVQAIVTHLEGFPRERAEAASRRARFYGVYSYQGVKSILAKALDFEPLPEVPVRSKPDTPPRFARSVAEILASHVLLLGPSGVGKSHVAQALGQRACRHGHKVLYVTAHDMFKQLRAARGDDSHDRKLLRFTEPALLILDDLGLRSLEPHETLDLYDVIRLRYERGSIIVTSNRAVEELPAIFGDPLLSSAAMDRLLDDAHVLVLEGHSYRNPPQNKRNSRRTKEAA